jgi:hypothetical protein
MFLGTFFAFSVLKFASSVPIKVTNEDLTNGKKNSHYILYETSPFFSYTIHGILTYKGTQLPLT